MVLAEFNLLIEALLAGKIQRSGFQPWEIEILLDVMNCDLGGAKKTKAVLHQYREAVARQLEGGAALPMKLSEFLASNGPKVKAANKPRRPRSGAYRNSAGV